MNLKRTTLIPLVDATLAIFIFKSFLKKEMMAIMVILGDTASVREAIPKAHILAQLSYLKMERRVLWFPPFNLPRLPINSIKQP